MIWSLAQRGVSGVWAGWAIAHSVFGRIEGAAGQRRRAALHLAHPVLGSELRPCWVLTSESQKLYIFLN